MNIVCESTTKLLMIKSAKLLCLIYTVQDWTDEFLQWDPNDYGGLESITYGHDKLWKPDINLIEKYVTVQLCKSLLQIINCE